MGKSKSLRQQAGAIPYRIVENGAEICVITASSGRWSFPKGFIEEDETDVEAALKEAYEEAGIHGVIEGSALGAYEATKTGNTLNVVMFLMKVEQEDEDWPESGMRKRRWLSVDEAKDTIALESQRELLRKALSLIESD